MKRHRQFSPRPLLAALCLWTAAAAAPAHAALLTVGMATDPACQYHDLATAFAAARTLPNPPHEIRVSDGHYHGVALAAVNLNAELRGGFFGCSPDAVQGGVSTLHGDGARPVLSVTGFAGTTMGLERFVLRGGGNTTVDGGGLHVEGGVFVRLRQVTIESNAGRFGGGLFLSAGARVDLLRETRVRFNTALYHGGGASLWNGSTLNVHNDRVAIESNQAALQGGGVHVRDTSRVNVDNRETVPAGVAVEGARIAGNVAGEFGGGLALLGGSVLDARELAFDDNQAKYGGGIYAESGAQVVLRRDDGGTQATCAANLPCTRFTGNVGTLDGGALFVNRAFAQLRQARVTGNRSRRSIVLANGDGVAIEGVLFARNRLDIAGSAVVFFDKFASAPEYTGSVLHASFIDNRWDDGASNGNARTVFASSSAGMAVGGSAFDTAQPPEVLASGPCNLDRVQNTAYRDAAADDFVPRGAGVLVDRCAAGALPITVGDPHLQPRCTDAAAPDEGGACDIGAYELPPPEATSLALDFDPPAPVAGETVKVRVRVEGASTRPANAGMSVQVEGGQSCNGDTGTPQDERVLAFSCTLAFAAIGEHVVTAAYAGTDAHSAATAQTTVTIAGRAETTVNVIEIAPALAIVGESFRLVMRVDGGPHTPTGTVTADAGQAGTCSATLVDGTAACELTPALAGGEHRLVVTYGGDTRHLPGSYGALTLRVQGESDLRIGIDNHAARVGATTTYDVLMTNAGPDPAFDATIAVQTEAALLDGGDWTCVGDRGVPCPARKSWQATHTVPAGAAVHYRLTLRFAPHEAPVTTHARAVPAIDGSDPVTGNNAASDGPDTRATFRDGFED